MLPRQVLPGQFYMITGRCSQRQFLLRPDRETNNAFTYCLLEAALRCEVEVLLTCAMSNHHHTVIYDRWGRYPEFVEHFHKMFARSQNALRGRWENLWSSDQVCVVNLVDRDAVMDKLVYTATNPVVDHLVDRVHHWPGINGLTALLAGRCLRATRPQHFFRPDGPMPEAVEMRLAIPPELGSEAELLAELRDPSVLSSSISISRSSAAAPAVGCWDGAACSRSRGAINRRAASPDGTCGRGWRPGASERGSRRCCATVHSSRTTYAPGSNGGTVRPSRFRPTPTGSDDSRTWRWQRRKRG